MAWDSGDLDTNALSVDIISFLIFPSKGHPKNLSLPPVVLISINLVVELGDDDVPGIKRVGEYSHDFFVQYDSNRTDRP